MDLARRTGNTHGRFQDCTRCGTVWSGVQYQVSDTAEVIVYPYLHGYRKVPGGNIVPPPGGPLRKAEESLRSSHK